MRWFVEEYFKSNSTALKKTIGNLTLGCLGASEVTVEIADVYQLESQVGQ